MEAKEYEGIVYVSGKMERVCREVEYVAGIEIPVLITGESGVGKELVAIAIKNKSLRRDKKFVVIDCAGIKYELFESELFGHIKGAFTGAIANRKGLFETASGGTVFFDEISEVPLNLQARLLRLIETRSFRPVGSSEDYRNANVRILAATSKDLYYLVKEGRFRADLYYRLKRFCINIPPLRERIEDIPVLINYFTDKFQKLHDKELKRPMGDLVSALIQMEWRGNVRELENAIESEVVKPFSALDSEFFLENILMNSNLHLNGDRDGSKKLALEEGRALLDKVMIERVISNSLTLESAADKLLVSSKTLRRRMMTLGINKENLGKSL